MRKRSPLARLGGTPADSPNGTDPSKPPFVLEAIVLHEPPNAGSTIIEKSERHADVQYAIVLLSADDVGAASSDASNLRGRPRQNVVLELGYFIGRLGRARVFALVRGKLELPSDIHGIVYTLFEGESWKLRLIKEIKNVGFAVDANTAF